jgi:hypothetical protein
MMLRLFLSGIVAWVTVMAQYLPVRILGGPPSSGDLIAGSDLAYLGRYALRSRGDDTSYGMGLSLRKVAGQTRFLMIQSVGNLPVIDEVSIAGLSYEQTVVAPTRTWLTPYAGSDPRGRWPVSPRMRTRIRWLLWEGAWRERWTNVHRVAGHDRTVCRLPIPERATTYVMLGDDIRADAPVCKPCEGHRLSTSTPRRW